jgi:hypothetical protein
MPAEEEAGFGWQGPRGDLETETIGRALSRCVRRVIGGSFKRFCPSDGFPFVFSGAPPAAFFRLVLTRGYVPSTSSVD